MLEEKKLSRWLRRLLGTTNLKTHTNRTMTNKRRRMLLESLERREVFDAGWATAIQGATITTMVGDSAGNTYVTGSFVSQANIGGSVYSNNDGRHFIAKSNSNGQVLWVSQFGPTTGSDTRARDLALDATGSMFVTGMFEGTVPFGSQSLTSAGGTDIFLAKLNCADGSLIWAQSKGADKDDFALAVAVDQAGNAILSVGLDSVDEVSRGNSAPVVAVVKISPAGTEIWSSAVTSEQPGGLSAKFRSLVVDSAGDIYATGTLKGTAQFPTGSITSAAYLPTSNGSGNVDALLAKLNGNGTWIWAKSLPGDTLGSIYESTIGPDSQLYVTGSFEGTVNFDDAALTSAGDRDGFVSRIDPATGNLSWAKRFGGIASDYATDIDFDPQGRLLVAGTFRSSAAFGNQSLVADPATNSFVTAMDSSGTFLESHRVLTGANTSYGVAINVDSFGAVTVSGSLWGSLPGQAPQRELAFGPTLNSYLVKLPPAAPTKFYVVDDSANDRTYQYAGNGELTIDHFPMNTGNTSPRGAASNSAGTTLWVADKNRNVYVYSNSGALQGSWTASSLSWTAQVEGVATNGTDIWIVDNKTDKVFRHSEAASRLSGSQSAASSFSLNRANSNPKGIVTDGNSIWVVNDSTTDKIFKYTVSGKFLGSWTIDSANMAPTGLTIDPTNGSQDIWVVDNGTDKIYQYSNSRSRTSGSQVSAATYALAIGNTNPQGIADPPPPSISVNHAPMTSVVSSNTRLAVPAASNRLQTPALPIGVQSADFLVPKQAALNALLDSKRIDKAVLPLASLRPAAPNSLIMDSAMPSTPILPRVSTAEDQYVDLAFADDDLFDSLRTTTRELLELSIG